VLELHHRIVGPEHLAQLFARYHLARLVQQHRQDAERLLMQLQLDPVFAQLGSRDVEFERAETDDARQWFIPFLSV
jgi:hypothetical protein